MVKEYFHKMEQSDCTDQSSERYRSFWEQCADAILFTTADGQVVEANQACLDLLGYTREAMIGMNIGLSYVDPHDGLLFQQEMEQKGHVRDFETRLRSKDGTEIDCLINASLWTTTEGNILG